MTCWFFYMSFLSRLPYRWQVQCIFPDIRRMHCPTHRRQLSRMTYWYLSWVICKNVCMWRGCASRNSRYCNPFGSAVTPYLFMTELKNSFELMHNRRAEFFLAKTIQIRAYVGHILLGKIFLGWLNELLCFLTSLRTFWTFCCRSGSRKLILSEYLILS